VDPARNNVLWVDICDVSADKFGQLRPFRDLMFNCRLDILLFLLSTVLPLDVFYRATAEVVSSVLLRDDIPPPSPGNPNLGSKTSHFRFDLCSLDPVSSSFQLRFAVARDRRYLGLGEAQREHRPARELEREDHA
jgi:hypothetical protein